MKAVAMKSSIAVAASLFVFSVALHADDNKNKKNESTPPQRSAPAPERHSAPPPTVRSEPSGRQYNPPPRQSGGYQPNTESNTGHRGGGYERNTNNAPQNVNQPNPNSGNQGRYDRHTNTNTPQSVYQPNPNSNTGNQGRYERNTNTPQSVIQPNPNAGNQGRYERNTNTNTPQNVYQPNPNFNSGRQGGYQRNTSPNTGIQGGYQTNNPNTSTIRTYTPGRTRDGGEIRPLAGGRSEYRGPNNTSAVFHRDGSVNEVRARGMVITHGPIGERRVIVDRPDHTRIVTYGRDRGYVQRTYVVSGRSYYQRTYYVRGVAYSRVYRPYYYGGIAYYRYVPAFYYRPAFYGWAFNPWPGPVFYRWGWFGAPWYTYYGGYFAPYPSYPSAGLWLTDYMIASSLQDAYQQQMDANVNVGGQVDYSQGGVSPEVKQAIADEVQRQLAQERYESQNTGGDPNAAAPPFGDNDSHVFVVSASLNLTTSEGQQCAVTQGDVLGMNGTPPPDATLANVRVLASKGSDCQQGSVVAVSMEDLQEMQNHMREVIDQGLGELQSRGGQNGLPALPAQARGQSPSPIASAAPPPDSNASTELTQQEQQATQTEQEVVNQASADPMPQPDANPSVVIQPAQQAPVTISLGQTPDQVVALLGQPKQIVDLGAKKMYVYTEMKVIFMDGKVTDVQ